MTRAVVAVAAAAMGTMWAMAMGQGWWATKRERVRTARGNAIAMRVVGIKEGKGGKAMVMAMATRVVGKQMARAMTRAMVVKMKEVGEEEGNGKGGKSNGDGKEDGDGKQQ